MTNPAPLAPASTRTWLSPICSRHGRLLISTGMPSGTTFHGGSPSVTAGGSVSRPWHQRAAWAKRFSPAVATGVSASMATSAASGSLRSTATTSANWSSGRRGDSRWRRRRRRAARARSGSVAAVVQASISLAGRVSSCHSTQSQPLASSAMLKSSSAPSLWRVKVRTALPGSERSCQRSDSASSLPGLASYLDSSFSTGVIAGMVRPARSSVVLPTTRPVQPRTRSSSQAPRQRRTSSWGGIGRCLLHALSGAVDEATGAGRSGRAKTTAPAISPPESRTGRSQAKRRRRVAW